MNYRAARRGRSRAEFIAKLGIVVEEIQSPARRTLLTSTRTSYSFTS